MSLFAPGKQGCIRSAISELRPRAGSRLLLAMRPRRPFLHDCERPLAFAHRGGAALFPENTLTAFEGAQRLGCVYIETDVHMTADGVIVVLHDEALERTTNGRGLVRASTFAELELLDAGFHFSSDGVSFPWRGQDIRITSFEELVTKLPQARFNVELKQAEPSIVEPFWQLVQRLALYDRVLVAAARDEIVRDFRRVSRGRVATSAGENETRRFWIASRLGATRLLRIGYDALQVPPRHGELTIVDRRFVEAAHARSLQVHVWTIDDPGEMRRLLALGVDGLMSDRPDLLTGVVRDLRSKRLGETLAP